MATISDHMKSFTAVLAICVLGSTAARASSFVEIDDIDTTQGSSIVVPGDTAVAPTGAESPSILALGSDATPKPLAATLSDRNGPDAIDASPNAAAAFVSVSPSIIATAAAFAGIDEARTAAIDGDDGTQRRPPHFKPMVIRGGLLGDAYAQPLPETDRVASPRAASAPKAADDGPSQGPENAPEPPPPALPPQVTRPQ